MHINSIKPIQFLGQRDGVAFRKEARSLIKELENIKAGSWEYWGQTKEGEDTVQERLAKAVFIMPEKIGAEYITKVDRSLHERLKVLYKLLFQNCFDLQYKKWCQ